jgi:hypothetical protein
LDSTSPAPWILLLAVPLGSVAFWVGICHLIAALGGWSTLARAYPPHSLPAGERIRFQAARLRHSTHYNGCLTLFASPLGLRFTIWPIFRGHAPFEVPWGEIEAWSERVWLTRLVTLRFRRAPEVPVRIGTRLAERLVQASGQQLRVAQGS